LRVKKKRHEFFCPEAKQFQLGLPLPMPANNCKIDLDATR